MSIVTDPPTQRIRPLAMEDSQPLGEFFDYLGRDEQTRRFFHPHPLTADYARYLCQRTGAMLDEYFVYWERDRIIGYGMLRGWDEGYEVPSFGVCVLPSRRAEGIGQRLLVYALDRCRLRGARRLRLTVYRDNIWAVHVYRKFGFVFTAKNNEELVGILDLTPEAPGPLQGSMKTRNQDSLHLGIFADYGTTLQPDEGIGVFVHHLIAALRRIAPELRITLWAHPGEEHRVGRLLRKHGEAVQVFPPPRWKWLGRWLDGIEDLRSLLRDQVMSRISGFLQRTFIVLWKQRSGDSALSWRSRLLRIGMLVCLLLAAPFVWLTAVCYHLIVHGLLRSLSFPAAVLLRGWNQDHLPPQPDCDVWLVPLGRTPAAFQAPEIVVLWDLAHHHVSGIFSPDMAETTDFLFASRVDRAAAVVCAADTVRRSDLLRTYPHAADRLHVIPLAIPEDMKPPTAEEKDRLRRRFGLRRPFLFYPAALRNHKNHRTLIEALHQLRSRYGLDLDLVCTGKGDVPSEIAEAVTRLELQEKVRFLGLVPRQDLPGLYSLAAATVIPSLHEGFGLPVLEALACGGLLTCSNLPSFRELLNDFEEAVVWFDPRFADAIASAVARTLQERDRLAHAQQQALGRLAQRTWDDVARDYLHLFREVAFTCMPAAGSVRGKEIPAHV